MSDSGAECNVVVFRFFLGGPGNLASSSNKLSSIARGLLRSPLEFPRSPKPPLPSSLNLLVFDHTRSVSHMVLDVVFSRVYDYVFE